MIGRETTRRRSKGVLIVALALLAIVGSHVVMAQAAAAASDPQYGGVLKIGIQYDAEKLGYPPSVTKSFVRAFMRTALESLLRFDSSGAIAAGLATAWELDADAKTIRLTLREGVTYHDGTPFNAATAAWNLNQYIDSDKSELDVVESVEIADEYTVILHLSAYDNLILTHLASTAGFMISPVAYYQHGQEWCETHPVGTGPFKFVEWSLGEYLKFERFDEYWDQPKPYLDGVEWHIIVDTFTATASFKAGEVDVWYGVTPETIAELEALGYSMSFSSGGGQYALIGDGAHEDSPYANKLVRQAIGHAIDKEAIAETVGQGYWVPIEQGASPGSEGESPDVVGYEYNPTKAMELLAQAGYPNGFSTTLYGLSPIDYIATTMTVIQGYLQDVGIDAELDLMEHGRFYSIFVGGGWEDGITIMPTGPTTPDALMYLNRVFGPESVLFPSRLSPPEVENLIAEARLASDLEAKTSLTHEIQRLISDEYCIVTWLYALRSAAAKHAYVYGDSIFDYSVQEEWTPADAWLDE